MSLFQMKIPATYMRGGTSKGVLFNLDKLPEKAQVAGEYRDAILLRVIGSPDPYAKHTDGMGGATSSTSKTAIISKSNVEGHDVDYLFGQVAIDKPFIDWSGNCGNLTAAVGAFAINQGLVNKAKIPDNGFAEVSIWQANIGKTIIAKIPMLDGQVQELGDFELDGVTFPAAEVEISFIDPSSGDESMFPTGNLIDKISIPGVGDFNATCINAGIPTIFVNADEIGYRGTELQEDINSSDEALSFFENLRAHGALKMGLIEDLEEAKSRQHTPKIAFVSPAKGYVSSSGKQIDQNDIDLNVRALSMGKLHHAMMGTAAVAIATAAVIPGTLVNLAAGDVSDSVTFGHPSGTLRVGADAQCEQGEWRAVKAVMSRSARTLMDGVVCVPSPK